MWARACQLYETRINDMKADHNAKVRETDQRFKSELTAVTKRRIEAEEAAEKIRRQLESTELDLQHVRRLCTLNDTIHRSSTSHNDWVQKQETANTHAFIEKLVIQSAIARWRHRAMKWHMTASAGLYVFASTKWRNTARRFWFGRVTALALVVLKEKEIENLISKYDVEAKRQLRLRQDKEKELNGQILGMQGQMEDLMYKYDEAKARVRDLSTRLATGAVNGMVELEISREQRTVVDSVPMAELHLAKVPQGDKAAR